MISESIETAYLRSEEILTLGWPHRKIKYNDSRNESGQTTELWV